MPSKPWNYAVDVPTGLQSGACRQGDLRPHADGMEDVAVAQCLLANGRLELLHYLREQSVSETTHRYGNIIPKPADLLKG